ncbi:MAG: hypothetical protein U1E20_00340 [Methylocystis sp.]
MFFKDGRINVVVVVAGVLAALAWLSFLMFLVGVRAGRYSL